MRRSSASPLHKLRSHPEHLLNNSGLENVERFSGGGQSAIVQKGDLIRIAKSEVEIL